MAINTNINDKNKNFILVIPSTIKSCIVKVFSFLLRCIKALGRFNKRIWKIIVGIGVILIIIAIYDYYKNTYIPHKLLQKAIYEIESNLHSENDSIKITYSYYILEKRHDWEFEDVINGEINHELSNCKSQAFHNIEDAAYAGNPRAQYILGQLYRWGYSNLDLDETKYAKFSNFFKGFNKLYGIAKLDEAKAAYWWNEAASQGYKSAYNNLGIAYEEGKGVKQDLRLAVEWIKKGAEAGENNAQWNYGRYFRDGVKIKIGSHKEQRKTKDNYYGSNDNIIREYYDHTTYDKVTEYWEIVDDYETLIPIDINQAKYWWKNAAVQGNKEAKEALQQIYN